MKDYYNDFMVLDADTKKKLHIKACQFSLHIWEKFAQQGKNLSYLDSVVSMRHTIDNNIPKRALKAVKMKQSNHEISKNYREPIVALQDMDWQPPERIEFAYYSIYNLYQKYCQGIDVDDWLIINQCIAAQSNDDCRTVLFDVLGQATQY